jgi:hypothetical protein
VFLSHSSTDVDLAERLCDCLEGKGIACWMAPRDVTPGRPYAVECLTGAAESDCLVLLASPAALSSVQVLSEIEQAHKRSHPIYTVLIPPAKVQGEADFYLSRLHWLQLAGHAPEDVAGAIAAAIRRPETWHAAAAPPSLRRTMRYRPVAFAKLMGAAMLTLVLVLGGAAFGINRMLDHDFRRMGYVNLSADRDAGNPGVVGHAQVWLMAQGVAFRDVQLKFAAEAPDGARQQGSGPAWKFPEQVGAMQVVDFDVPGSVRLLTTCLIVPRAGLHARYRITQHFAVGQSGDGVEVAETAEKSVAKEDGSPCGAAP